MLFCLIAVGYVCGKSGLISLSALPSLNNLVLYVAIPCSLISAFQLDLTPETLRDLLVSLAAVVGIYAVTFPLAHLLIRDGDPYRKRLLSLAAVVPNCNFMGFPLLTAIIGPMGIFYGSAYAAINPVFIWTIGIIYLQGGLKGFNWKKAILNPGIMGIAAGLFVFLGGITLPSVLNQGVTHLANLAVPVPMIIIGVQLAHTNVRRAARDRQSWLTAALRLVIFPLGTLLCMFALGIRGNVLLATTIATATPPAVIIAMFDKPDSTTGAEVVSLHTLCSIVTLPIIVSLAQVLA